VRSSSSFLLRRWTWCGGDVGAWFGRELESIWIRRTRRSLDVPLSWSQVSEKVHIGGKRHGGGSPCVVGHRDEEVDLLPSCTDSLSELGWAGARSCLWGWLLGCDGMSVWIPSLLFLLFCIFYFVLLFKFKICLKYFESLTSIEKYQRWCSNDCIGTFLDLLIWLYCNIIWF
jgi:hypothetical protein